MTEDLVKKEEINQSAIPYAPWRGQVMEKVKDDITDEVVELRYNKKNRRFYFHHAGQQYTHSTVGMLATKAYDLLRTSRVIDFIPVVRVSFEGNAKNQNNPGDSFQDPGEGSAEINIDYERLWIGHHNGARLVRKVEWGNKEWCDEQNDGSEEIMRAMIGNSSVYWTDLDTMPSLPYENKAHWRSDRGVHLPYTEELWANLERFVDVVRAANSEIETLMQPENIMQLSKEGTLLLGS